MPFGTLHGNKEIQKKCLTFQLKSKNETYNFHKIEHFLILLNIQNLLTEPYDPKKSKTEINLAVNQFFEIIKLLMKYIKNLHLYYFLN